jgi:N-acyl-D-amino-acid deacylase
MPHPRAFGTFPRIFARYVRATRLLAPEEAVRRCTSLPATRLGLRKRGTIAVGWHADLVVFDADAILDTATYAEPQRFPDGIRHVFVNGVTVVKDGRTTGERPGLVLRRGRDL